MVDFNFGPASIGEVIVYGAAGPNNNVNEWIIFMRHHGIVRVCCLQPEREREKRLIDNYYKEFGDDNVRETPITDFHLCSFSALEQEILSFLDNSYNEKKRVVVHCHGGNGRTGHVLPAWLAFKYRLDPSEAVSRVERMGRNPREAIHRRNATEEQLTALLLKCKDLTIH